LLFLLLACDQPQTGSPGLEPPHERFGDAGPVMRPAAGDSDGKAQNSADAGGEPPLTPSGPAQGMGMPTTPNTPSGNAGNGGEPMMTGTQPPPADVGEEDGGVAAGDTRNPLFVGLWVIEQSAPAEYQATLYELQQGGDLLEHDTFDLNAPPYEGYVTGTVSAAGTTTLRCAFGAHWQSEDARRLRVDSHCTDGIDRAVTLAFPEGDEMTGLVPTIESVAGEPGWMHEDRAWIFRKCKSRELCFPF
jgi:hypothetical protein